MNIFYLSHNIPESVQMLHDRHVVKMVLESTQILCTRLNEQGFQSPYKSTHKNHPCVKWTIMLDNWKWLLSYTTSLLEEYTYRFGKKHKCADIVAWIYSILQYSPFVRRVCNGEEIRLKFECKLYTLPPQCMPEQYKCKDTVQAYRNYYCGEKIYDKKGELNRWTKREKPEFVQEYINNREKKNVKD
jgi:hypothetical protein